LLKRRSVVMGYQTMYIGIGAFGYLRRVMNKEFKRVGITKAKDKYGYFMEVLKEAPTLKEASIIQMEKVIQELRKLPDAYFSHLIDEAKTEKREPNSFSIYVKNMRDDFGWSNNVFHAMTGISAYRLARIATGTLEATEAEKKRISEVFERTKQVSEGWKR